MKIKKKIVNKSCEQKLGTKRLSWSGGLVGGWLRKAENRAKAQQSWGLGFAELGNLKCSLQNSFLLPCPYGSAKCKMFKFNWLRKKIRNCWFEVLMKTIDTIAWKGNPLLKQIYSTFHILYLFVNQGDRQLS